MHRIATADEDIAIAGGLCFLEHLRRLASESARLKRGHEQACKLPGMEWFELILVRAERHRLDGGLGGAAARQKDHGDACIDLVNLAKYIEAGIVRQPDIKHHDVGREGAKQLD